MAIFYRGAGVGTWWHKNDPRHSGFTPQASGMPPGLDRLMAHISHGTKDSPYVSLTRSYGVARSYALKAGHIPPTPTSPALVWEIELTDPLPAGLTLYDPVQVVAAEVPTPTSGNPYQHDGAQNTLIALIDTSQASLLKEPCPMPRGCNPPHPLPHISTHIRAIVFALRDAELLALGTIPRHCIRARHEEF
jgi:hypothetical protein